MKSTFVCTCFVVVLALDTAGQARVGLQHTPPQPGMSPGLVAGLATLSTAVPLITGAKMLYAEQNEGLGVALLAWGWIVGPAPFSLYYRDTTAGLVGLGIRSACVLAASAAVSGGTWDEDGSTGTETFLLAVMVVSGVTTVLNIVGLPAAVRRYNENQRLSIAPWVSPNGGGMSVAVRL